MKLSAALALLSILALPFRSSATTLETGWDHPPVESRVRAYWWWLNGNVTRASITRDLEEMKAKGFGGAVIVDANGAAQDGNAPVPHGPTFFTPEWRELYRHTLREAARLGLEISLNIQSGWNLGGPADIVSQDDAGKKYVWSELEIAGGTNIEQKLPQPGARENYYRDTAVVAFRLGPAPRRDQASGLKTAPTAHAPLKNWKLKALQESLHSSSAPDSSPLFQEIPAMPGEEDARADDVLDLSRYLGADGVLRWKARQGEWQILRFGYTIGDYCHVSTCSDGWNGYALDVYSASAFQHYWDKVVEPLIADAGNLAGNTLEYLHTDSWEIELANWTPALPAEFRRRRGYDLLPWLPVLSGRIVNSREESDRFLFDYRKTLGDLAIDGHYRLFRDNAHRRGVGIHPESGGPHAVPIDAQRCLGWDDAPMSEFWAWSWTHRIGDDNRFFIKQPASAAHTCGHPFVFGEGFTDMGPHWQESLWSNLKPSFDKALCEGLNMLVWHAFVCSPDEMGIPGQQYFAGTHLNPKVTWWGKSMAFFGYIDRCQWMLQQGHFCADVLYYYGDHVPNFTQLKRSDPAHCLPGYDYDVISEEALLERASVKGGKVVLPGGTSYRVLVLPDREAIALPVLKKVKELVAGGATVLGPKPAKGETLKNFAATDAAVAQLAGGLWGGKTGAGRVISGKSAREVLLADGMPPDCEFESETPRDAFDYIHRATDDAEIYFVASRTNLPASATVAFRVSGRAPELWNAVTGEHHFVAAFEEKNGRTFVPLDFDPCGSWFVVFREPSSAHPATAKSNGAELKLMREISGPWTVHFDPKWGGPETAQLDRLVSWTTRSEPGIKFYSGTAVYEKSLDWKPDDGDPKARILLDLGDVRELAVVTVNGKSCGTVWCPPWSVDVTDALRAGRNKLHIEVVNFWPNRIIGDASLPESQRLTRTNIRKLTARTPLEDSGLLGPVILLSAPPAP